MNARSGARAVPTQAEVSRTLGFTLIELMAVLVILAVLAGLAAPAFASLIRTQRVKVAANDLVASLVFARSEAVKRNTDVTITPVGGSWSTGWNVTYVDGGTKTARAHAALDQLSIATTTTSLTFGGGGRADADATFTVDSNPQAPGVSARCVNLRTDGTTRTWAERGGDHDCTND